MIKVAYVGFATFRHNWMKPKKTTVKTKTLYRVQHGQQNLPHILVMYTEDLVIRQTTYHSVATDKL